MLTVKTYLDKTIGKGIGLYASELIEKGKVVWEQDKHFNKTFTAEEAKSFTGLQKQFAETYMIHNEDGTLELDLDNARFMNHSSTPNIICSETSCVACRDIREGEEIVVDYMTIDDSYVKDGQLDFKVVE